jgi:A/G-specific adenine glycosylase
MDKILFVTNDHHRVDAVAIRRALIAWGREHFRPFPWRQTEDPYAILMAEVMLHRTQAPQVLPAYERLLKRCPDVSTLAQISKEELYSLLSSLGLRWRIDLIQVMATELVARFGGQVPQDKVDLLSLSGVSEYIASAVRCFAWNLPEPIIDTNTVRVVGRLFGLEIKDSSRRNRRFRELITALVDQDEPRTYNFALLDLADRICMKKRPPACSICPLQNHCVYGRNASIHAQANETGAKAAGSPISATNVHISFSSS